MTEWRVTWLTINHTTRTKVFDAEDEARAWLEYLTTGWGADATAELACRRVSPWEVRHKVGPLPLDHSNAKVM